MKHTKVLDSLRHRLEKDANVVALLVFGSVAHGTHHEKSDIDLFVIYSNYPSGYSFSTDIIYGIKVGFSRFSEERLRWNLEKFPYRSYLFAHATLLFDKDQITILQRKALTYLRAHPAVQKEWEKYLLLYEKEKQKYGAGRTSIFDVHHKLDKKFAKKSTLSHP